MLKPSKILLFVNIILFFVAIIFPTTVFSMDNNIENQLKIEKSKYSEIRKKIANARKLINESNKKEKSVTKQLNVLNDKITDTTNKVNIVTKDIKRVEGNIVVIINNINDTKKDISKAENYLKKRLVAVYKYGSDDVYNLFIFASGAQEAMKNSYLLDKIAKQDNKVLKELTEYKLKLDKSNSELNTQKNALNKKNMELEIQKKQLKTAVSEREITLKKIQQDKALYMAQQREFEQAAQALRGTINRLIAAKRSRNNKNTANKTGETVFYTGGKLQQPCQGRLTSSYGTRIHPVFKTKIKHAGLDIAAQQGTPIVAAESGEVLFAGTMRGYGLVVIIDHGANLTTVYGHMSKIICSENQKVKRGSIIGYVGMTGITTGPHCHFEVRVNGNTVNPMPYIK